MHKLLILSYILVLSACSKNSTDQQLPPVTPPPVIPVDSSVNINLYYPGAGYYDSQYELIVSTTSGNILLDTVTDVNTTTAFSFKTTEKLVDLTTISHSSSNDQYYLNSYKAVNPLQWDTLSFGRGYNVPLVSNNGPTAKLHCVNMPLNYNYNVFFGSYPDGTLAYSINLNTADFQYQQLPGAQAFILFPTLGVYKLYTPVSMADTISLSVLDTAISKKFTMSPQYQIYSVDLQGIPDTTDVSRVVWLYNNFLLRYPYTAADIEYPTRYFQKYQLIVNVNNSSNDYVYHFSYGDTVAYTFNFPDATNYNLTTTQKDNLSVKFTNIHPTYYSTNWTSGKVQWTIYASSDSSSLNPLAMINSLKTRSRSLNGMDFSDLGIKGFSFETIHNADYATYLEYTFNSKRRAKRLIYSTDRFTKAF